MTYPVPAAQALLLLTVLIAAFWDVRVRRIPNWLTFSTLVLGILMNSFLYGFAGLRSSLLGVAAAMAVYFPLYLLRAMGAGDVKLMAAVGSIVGAANWFGIFVLTGLVGGICALALLLYKGRLRTTLWNVSFLLREFARFRPPYVRRQELDVKNPAAITMPHGLMIAMGAVAFIVAAGIWAPR